MAKKEETKSKEDFYPPVVTVLGHVDHGKTSLLDAIRKTSIAEREHGGITQKIGASKVEIMHDGQKRSITFIDTPGHETFSKMRSRGALVADIGLLIVSSSDGIKPQTVESIQVLKSANIPYIVVLTKSDLPNKEVEKTKGALAKEGIQLEGYGGDVPVIEVSAKTGSNIKELLDLILLVWEMGGKKAQSESPTAIVIESKLDPRIGPKATIVVKSGVIKPRDQLYCEGIPLKVRSLIDDSGKQLQAASVGDAVEVLGFEKVPPVGGIVSTEKNAVVVQNVQKPVEPLDFFSETPQGSLSVIICADTLGSLEAVVDALPEELVIVSKKTGDITSSDVTHAKSTGAIVVGFNVKIPPNIAHLAKTEKVLMKNYTIIYELIDEVKDVMAGKLEALQEEVFGIAKVLASFPFEKTKVLGVSVSEGRVARGDKVRILRGETVVGESTIQSIRKGKESVSKVEAGAECGVVISPMLDFTIGDMVLSHN